MLITLDNTARAPIVYLNTVHGEGQAVWEACRKENCPPITPGDTPCTGGADEYLALLTEEIVPAVASINGGTIHERRSASFCII